jgi:tRNA (cytidine56-2'-O)-methyltransferase
MIIAGKDEDDTVNSICKVNSRGGGDFKIRADSNWRSIAKNWNGTIVHLTMYGEMLGEVLPRIESSLRERKKVLVIIGAEKVPKEVYSLADYNVAIGNQPHSEVAALAIFLDRIYKGKELYNTFERARLRINPSRSGKEVLRNA